MTGDGKAPLAERLAALLERIVAEVRSPEAAEALRVVRGELADLERETATLRELAVATSKLAELGRLAAAQNHELRQPVLAIKALGEFLRDDASRPDAVQAHAAQIREQADRMARLISAFRSVTLARPDAGEVADVAAVARGVANLVEYRLRRRVALELDIPVDLPRVCGPADRLEQILLNLVVNAIDAVEDRGRAGGIVLRARRGEGARVEIYVADDGAGLPAPARAQIFTPYYTTKGEGRGTGLGLAICRGLARAAGGAVELCEDEEIARLSPWPREVRTLFRVTLRAVG